MEVWENQETGERRRLGVSAQRPEGKEWMRVYPKPPVPEPKPPQPATAPKPKRRKRRVKAKPDTSDDQKDAFIDDIPEQPVCEPLPATN